MVGMHNAATCCKLLAVPYFVKHAGGYKKTFTDAIITVLFTPPVTALFIYTPLSMFGSLPQSAYSSRGWIGLHRSQVDGLEV